MKKFARIIGGLAFIVMFCAVGMFMHSRTARLAPPPSQNEAAKTKGQDLKIQRLTGDAAKLRAKQLRKVNKGMARAMKDAEKKRLREAFHEGVVVLATDATKTSSALAKRPDGYLRKTSLRSSPQTFSDGDYEVSFFPYDDGDPNTWEGIVYRNGPDIDEDTRSAVIDISTDVPEVREEIIYPQDGGDPCSTGDSARCLNQTISMSKKPRRPPALARFGGACTELTFLSHANPVRTTSHVLPECTPPAHRCIGKEAMGCCGPIPALDNWAKCSIFAGGGVALSCLGTGPGWGACWAARTGAGMFLCLKAA